MLQIMCPHCKNPIEDEDALLCHFCGGSLGRSSAGLLGVMRGAKLKWFWITLALLCAGGLIVSLF